MTINADYTFSRSPATYFRASTWIQWRLGSELSLTIENIFAAETCRGAAVPSRTARALPQTTVPNCPRSSRENLRIIDQAPRYLEIYNGLWIHRGSLVEDGDTHNN